MTTSTASQHLVNLEGDADDDLDIEDVMDDDSSDEDNIANNVE